jgi:hypothetical protein
LGYHVWGDLVRVLERRTLTEIIGGDGRPSAASDLCYARLEHGYPNDLLAAIHARSLQIRQTSHPKQQKFLGLDHLRRVQNLIPHVAELVHDPHRLERLSAVAGIELEPYPISTSCSGVNFYWPGQEPIEFHSDGPAFVELVPVHVDGSQHGGSTVVFRGPVDVGLARLRGDGRLAGDELTRIPQRVGSSVLLQGRMVLHTAEMLSDGHRATLVMSLRSKTEPWKDSNTLSRLLMDDRPEDVTTDWLTDVDTRQLPALRSFLFS